MLELMGVLPQGTRNLKQKGKQVTYVSTKKAFAYLHNCKLAKAQYFGNLVR